MLKNMKLNTKIIWLGVVLILIFSSIGYFGINGISTVTKHMNDLINKSETSSSQLYRISEAKGEVLIKQRTLLISKLDKVEAQLVIKTMEDSFASMNAAIAEHDKMKMTITETVEWGNFKTNWTDFYNQSRTFLADIKDYYNNGNKAAFENAKNLSFNELSTAYANFDSNIDKINKDNLSTLQEKTDAINEAKLADVIMISAIIAGVLLSIVICILIILYISRPLSKVIVNLNDSTYQVAEASIQLTSSGQQLAEGNAELASSIEETSSTLEEFTSMINQNNENTSQAAQLSKTAKMIADKGFAEMSAMQLSITEIKKSSEQMAKIIKVIDELAFQTNILSLNAAIEAARAGEAGLSFAVVADEVRNLANRSAKAAKDTAEIIEKNIEISLLGVEETQKIAISLTEITEQTKKVNELIDEIATASKEQAQGISSINKAIFQMEKVTQSNAANAEESASSAEEMSGQANLLNEMSRGLVKLVYGSSSKNQKNVGTTSFSSNKSFNNYNKNNTYEKRTHIVNPEDIIPLEDDNGGF